MQNTNQSKENAEVMEYKSPECTAFIVNTQNVICLSETEPVIDIDGEW